MKIAYALLVTAALLFVTESQAQVSANKSEVVNIATACYPTEFFVKDMGEISMFVMSESKNSQGHILLDAIFYSKNKKTIFVVRENTAIAMICVLSAFENVNKSNDPPLNNKNSKPSREANF